MTDIKPVYESDTISITEWPQPMCEIHDKTQNGYTHLREPEDVHAVIRSLESMLKAYAAQNSVPSAKSSCRSSADEVMGRCQELLVGYNSIHERADHAETISLTLGIVQDAFYLTPKVYDLMGTFVDVPDLGSSYKGSLSELWEQVSS